jgi:hypothetical protein
MTPGMCDCTIAELNAVYTYLCDSLFFFTLPFASFVLSKPPMFGVHTLLPP